ncbi:efflux RND transporter periplasmic adaptor subunit [Oceanospirillum sediminis]|uniref:Efflux RND transporter periplasmic adaptor subunit n=1 Tax=Oceanospirillum sediminis TaxID=2760088 RepID=A0A839IU16_9GAMM|nr:efflux RND transporter periplasmic adaptor subunit [Oceanospirillum sediminis]MBB1487606.1 efflux RND transporter periplasmic adaptor subunit [Oceanospirillum sediminis]
MISSKIRFSRIVAVAAVAGLIYWGMTAEVLSAQKEAPDAEDNAVSVSALTQVETRIIQAQSYDKQRVAQGQIEAWRSVELRAQVSGTVRELPVEQGHSLEAGDLLLKLSDSEFKARLRSAEAEVRLKKAELEAAKRLKRTNLQTETEVLRLQSELENARASLVSAKENLKHAAPVAPFAGVLDKNDAELGQFLSSGDSWGRLVNIDKLKVTAQIPQQHIAEVSVGQTTRVVLLDGRELEGVVSFVASAAETSTRSFRVEVMVENPEQLRIAGASATLVINLGSIRAHKVSPALLSLDDKGQLGVKWVDAADRVVFQKVELLSTGTDGAWIGGLPEKTRVISVGGGFVEHGQQVSPALADTASAGGN